MLVYAWKNSAGQAGERRRMRRKQTTKQNKRENILLLVILIGYFILQFPKLSNPAYEMIENWRQTDTYSIAINYLQYGMNLFAPQLNYDGIGNIYVQLELQIVPYLSALIFRCIGSASAFVPRLLSLLFYLGSAWFLFRILRRFTALLPAVMGVLLYLFMPVSLLFSRAIMPEACAMFFYCGAIRYLLDWYMERRLHAVWISAIFMAFAILEKIPVAFAGLLVLACFFWKERLDCFRRKEFWGYGIISLGLPLVYYAYASIVSTADCVDSIASKRIFTEGIPAFFTSDALDFFRTEMPDYFGVAVLIVAGVGFLLCFTPERKPLAVWAIAFALELVTIVAIIQFGYYLIFIAPVLAALCAVALENVKVRNALAAVACFAVVFGTELYHAIPYWNSATQVDDSVAHVAQTMDSISEPTDTFAVATGSPIYLNAANRRGYRANLKHYDDIPIGAAEETDYYIQRGISYFVVVDGTVYDDPTGEYLDYLNRTFPIVAQNEDCTIYDMREVQS